MYPVQIRYINKFSFILYGFFFWMPLHNTVYVGHFSWKRGKLPRLCHGDMKYQKFIMQVGMRNKLIHQPALEWYPDKVSKQRDAAALSFVKKHKPV